MHNSSSNLRPLNKIYRSSPLAFIAAVALLIITPFLIGYFVTNEIWPFALALLLVFPAFIIFVRNPIIALFIWLAIGPFIIVIPSSMQPVYWLVHRLLPVGALAVIWINHIIGLYPRDFPKPTLAELAMLLYSFASLVSVITTSNDLSDVITTFYDRVIIPMSLYFLIRIWAPQEKEIRQLIPMLLVLVFSQISIGLLAWSFPSVLPSYWLDWAGQRTTGSLRSYGAYVSVMLFAGLPLLHTALTSNGKLYKKILMIGFFLSLLGVFISFSRAGWLALGVVLIFLFYLYPKGMIRSTLLVLPIVLILAIGPLAGQIQWASQRLNSPESEASALSRLPTFMASVRMFQAKPFFGWGYENFNEYDFQFYTRVGDLVNPEKDHSSHNFFLTLLAEQGIIGFILFLLPIAYWAYQSKKNLHNFPDDGFLSKKIIYILWLFPIAFGILNLFQSMRVIFALGIFWINLGLIASLVTSKPITSSISKPYLRFSQIEGCEK